jgi:hypothetical protein
LGGYDNGFANSDNAQVFAHVGALFALLLYFGDL